MSNSYNIIMTTVQLIKMELARKNLSAAEIGRQAGVGRTVICHTIAGRRKSRRLRRAIAEAVDIPVENLWPDSHI
jgi:lambda repressor-like predicted transcriptional regulator